MPLIAIAHRPMAAITAYFLTPGSDEMYEEHRKAVHGARRWKSVNYELLARVAFLKTLLHAPKVDEAERQLRAVETLQARLGGDRFAPDQLYAELLWH